MLYCVIRYADTGKPIKNPKTGRPQKWEEPAAVKLCNRKGWKFRGRPVFITPDVPKD